MQVDWELSQSFTSDGQGVRAACVLAPRATAAPAAAPAAAAAAAAETKGEEEGRDAYRIVIASQSGGLCEFGVPSGSMQLIAYQHDNAVTALLSSAVHNIYVTGCKDSLIRWFDADTHTLLGTLTGHEKTVASLAWAGPQDQYLVSGSWDGTAKLWDLQKKCLLKTIDGHENSVCVVSLPVEKQLEGSIIKIATGSAGIAQNSVIRDHTIRIWQLDTAPPFQATKLSQVANDHAGPIRDISLAPPDQTLLASCSNDGTVKLRTTDTGEALTTLAFGLQNQQHPPLLLGVTTVADTIVAVAAEDGQVVLWDQSGGKSGNNEEPTILVHASCVWKIVALPEGDLATCCQDGTLRIFTRATERMAPVAEREAFTKSVTEALQKQQNGPSQEEIAKLPRWEDQMQHRGRSEGQVQVFQKNGVAIAAQWSAASQTWIEVGQVMGSSEETGTIDGVKYDHVFPIEVDQASGAVAKLQIGYNNGENPFTAAQRFIDAHMLPQYHLAQIADYIQQRVGQQGLSLGGPLPSAATTGVPMTTFEHLPSKTYKAFELPEKTASATLEKMKKKIEEFGKLDADKMAHVTSLMNKLEARSRYHAAKINDAELNVIGTMLGTFPPAEVFPALDLARLVVLIPDAADRPRHDFWKGLLSKVEALCKVEQNLQGPAAVAIPMLTLRIFANAFKGGPGSQQAIVDFLEPALAVTERFVKSGNKNIRLSVATLLSNVSFYIHSNPQKAASVIPAMVPMINTIVELKTYDAEALQRALVALGTLVLSSPEAKDAAKSLFLASKVEMAASPHTPQVKTTAKEVYNVLQ